MGGWLGEWVAGSPSDIRADLSSTEAGVAAGTELGNKIFLINKPSLCSGSCDDFNANKQI